MESPLKNGKSALHHSRRGLTALYALADLAAGRKGSRDTAEELMDLFSAGLSTRRGIVGYLAPRSRTSPVLSARGLDAGDIPFFRESALAAEEKAFLYLRKPGGGCVEGSLAEGANPGREEIAFFGALVPGRPEGVPFIAVDALFDDGVDPAEDLKLLAAAAAFLGPVFAGNSRDKGAEGRPRPKTLGRALQKHITAWIEPMDPSRSLLRSDLYERVMSEVEKILLAAALDKTDHVQTEAARFLGINRNTLSRKIRKYGLTGEDMERS